MRLWMAIALAGCTAEIPPACTDMCAAAAEVYPRCLEEWDAEWGDLGYDGHDDFVLTCTTWAWEMSHLARDAGHSPDALAGTCATREAALADPGADCATYQGFAWNTPPWETPE